MPPVTRIGDNCTGHDSCPPRPSVAGDSTVTVAGASVVRVGDAYAVHGCDTCLPHAAVLAAGSLAVSIHKKALGRIGDPVSCGGAVAVGEASVTAGNKGGEAYGNELAMSMVQEALAPIATEQEKIMLCLHEIAEAEAARQSSVHDRQGWQYLAAMFRKWFAGKANSDLKANPNPFWVEWDWIMSYRRARFYYHSMILDSNLFSEAAKESLASILQDDGAFSKFETFTFNHITLPHSEWDTHYFLYQVVPLFPLLDGLTAAMAGFTLRALAKGFVEYLGTGRHRITITDVAVFVHDGFNFAGDTNLRYWSCKEKKFSTMPGESFIKIENVFFNIFRRTFNRGNDFLVLSQPHFVDGFMGTSYEY